MHLFDWGSHQDTAAIAHSRGGLGERCKAEAVAGGAFADDMILQGLTAG